jgi:hypothetical protein
MSIICCIQLYRTGEEKEEIKKEKTKNKKKKGKKGETERERENTLTSNTLEEGLKQK